MNLCASFFQYEPLAPSPTTTTTSRSQHSRENHHVRTSPKRRLHAAVRDCGSPSDSDHRDAAAGVVDGTDNPEFFASAEDTDEDSDGDDELWNESYHVGNTTLAENGNNNDAPFWDNDSQHQRQQQQQQQQWDTAASATVGEDSRGFVERREGGNVVGVATGVTAEDFATDG